MHIQLSHVYTLHVTFLDMAVFLKAPVLLMPGKALLDKGGLLMTNFVNAMLLVLLVLHCFPSQE